MDSRRNRPFATLPAPHANVHILVPDDDDERRAIVCYTGLPEALLAAGAIEPQMLEGARTCGSGSVSEGLSYRRTLCGTGGRIYVVRYIYSSAVLRALPGVPEDCVPKAITWLRNNPGRLHVSADKDHEKIVGTREALIAEGLAGADDFVFDDWCRDLSAVSGYRYVRLHRCMDGFYRVERLKSPSRPEAFAMRPGRPSYLRLVVDNTVRR